jgi:hypothetical protein
VQHRVRECDAAFSVFMVRYCEAGCLQGAVTVSLINLGRTDHIMPYPTLPYGAHFIPRYQLSAPGNRVQRDFLLSAPRHATTATSRNFDLVLLFWRQPQPSSSSPFAHPFIRRLTSPTTTNRRCRLPLPSACTTLPFLRHHQ